jgi:hypothetical protein
MANIFKLEDGREFEVKESIKQFEDHWVVDGYRIAKKVEKVLIHRHLTTPDGTRLVSRHRHDYKTHLDANGKEYMIDGGDAYLRCSANGDEEIFELYNTDDIEVIREYIGRGGYGKDGKGPFRTALLKDMSDAWVANSITYVGNLQVTLKNIYQRELDYRKANNISIKD